ncbi:MAG: helicase-related protein [Pseudomonadota bacterium]
MTKSKTDKPESPHPFKIDARPHFIDNHQGNNLVAALKAFLGVPHYKTSTAGHYAQDAAGDAPSQANSMIDEVILDDLYTDGLDDTPGQRFSRDDQATAIETKKGDGDLYIATAFLTPQGLARLAPILVRMNKVRILIGVEPDTDPMVWQRALGIDAHTLKAQHLQDQLSKQDHSLRENRNHLPFLPDAMTTLKKLVSLLRKGDIEIRRYTQNFLHAKAYIIAPHAQDTDIDIEKGKGTAWTIGLDEDKTEDKSQNESQNEIKDKAEDENQNETQNENQGIIVGSANLTQAGLFSNLELSLGRYDSQTIQRGRAWFDDLWKDAEAFNIDDLLDEIFTPQDPFIIFLRVLWELYHDDSAHHDHDHQNNLGGADHISLTAFQRAGAERAWRLIKTHGGVIVADEVGLGKSFIAAELIKRYRQQRQRALLICPAALRDSTWKQFQHDYGMHIESVSYEELSRDTRLQDTRLKEKTAKETHKNKERKETHKLRYDIEDYQLIIIDEAHNYRNPVAPSRAGILRILLRGEPRKDVLMLTATPVNNSLWDLYHLLRFFIKQDGALAGQGILSIYKKFHLADELDPTDLSPDTLYPIIDATTVKRTRGFIKKYFPNDQFKTPKGHLMQVVFPKPLARTKNYEVNEQLDALFAKVERYLDPDAEPITFARYTPDHYRKKPNQDESNAQNNIQSAGLLRMGLLKRCESSTQAFEKSLTRMIRQHTFFLAALKQGQILTTAFFKEFSVNDDDFDDLLASLDDTSSGHPNDQETAQTITNITDYRVDDLKKDVSKDLEKLEDLYQSTHSLAKQNDPKLTALTQLLEEIAKKAKQDSITEEDHTNNRKVIVFSFFADTAKLIETYLQDHIHNHLPTDSSKDSPTDSSLAVYQHRIGLVTGDDPSQTAAARFAPDTASTSRKKRDDEIDILVSTDVMAEGVNLQQARHIINYDLPWNPMRLVQRHGRIDRIGSKHTHVYMDTIFPNKRLDSLLSLEERIIRKITQASVSIGVTSPIEAIKGTERNFTDRHQSIKKLHQENAELYENRGTPSASQSGEEYRQILRSHMETSKSLIQNMPWKSGSGMMKGKTQGMFFCAKIGHESQWERVYTRFVCTDKQWKPLSNSPPNASPNDNPSAQQPTIIDERATCLRLIECEQDQQCHFDDQIQQAAYDLWAIAQQHIYNAWMHETDPKNIQPPVDRLNRQVAKFIENHRPDSKTQHDIEKAIDIVRSPWPVRDKQYLSAWFAHNDLSDIEKAALLVDNILTSGMEATEHRAPLPPIRQDQVELVVWMAVTADPAAP